MARWTIDRPPQLRGLRAAMEERVRADEAAADLIERLMIVVTELAGNALRHGRPPAVVELSRSEDLLVLDVTDGDPANPPAVDTSRPLGAGGLGLQLAERLAKEVGWYPDAGRKHVWAAFELPPSRAVTGP